MAIMILYLSGFDLARYFEMAINNHSKGAAIMEPGTFLPDPVSAISLGLALMFGTAGLPHILMRFFTVKNAKEARKSVFYATGLIGYFYILTFVIGFGAIAFLLGNPEFINEAGQFTIPPNMEAVLLAKVLGGDGCLCYDFGCGGWTSHFWGECDKPRFVCQCLQRRQMRSTN